MILFILRLIKDTACSSYNRNHFPCNCSGTALIVFSRRRNFALAAYNAGINGKLCINIALYRNICCIIICFRKINYNMLVRSNIRKRNRIIFNSNNYSIYCYRCNFITFRNLPRNGSITIIFNNSLSFDFSTCNICNISSYLMCNGRCRSWIACFRIIWCEVIFNIMISIQIRNIKCKL